MFLMPNHVGKTDISKTVINKFTVYTLPHPVAQARLQDYMYLFVILGQTRIMPLC